MTVSTTISKSGPFACNGAQVIFDFDFDISVEGDLRVIHTTAAGVETDLVLTSGFTVSAGPWPNGGTITTVITYPTGDFITPKRALPYKQESDYATSGLLPAEDIESDLDHAVKLIQQLLEITDRALLLKESSIITDVTLPDPSPLKLLQWDALLNQLNNISISDFTLVGIAVSTFMETLFDDPDAATAQQTLDAAGLSANNTFSGINTFTKTQSWAFGASVVSANDLNLGKDGNSFRVLTGVNTINGINDDIPLGTIFVLRLEDSILLKHSVAPGAGFKRLLLQGDADIQVGSGDVAIFVSFNSTFHMMIGFLDNSRSPVDVGWKLVESVATTSGASQETTLITPDTTQIKIAFDEVSASVTASEFGIELGSSTYSGSGATGIITRIVNASNPSLAAWGSGIALVTDANQAARVTSGIVMLIKHNDNTWSLSSNLSDGTDAYISAGSILAAGVIDRLRISVDAGLLDGGAIHVWEYS
jgi:hypothetical protein